MRALAVAPGLRQRLAQSRQSAGAAQSLRRGASRATTRRSRSARTTPTRISTKRWRCSRCGDYAAALPNTNGAGAAPACRRRKAAAGRYGSANIRSRAKPCCSTPSRGSATPSSSRVTCRCIAASGAKVVLEVQAELTTLMRRLDGAAAVIARGEAPPPFDVHCPLGSLPLALAHANRLRCRRKFLILRPTRRSSPNGRRGSARCRGRASPSPGRAIRATTTTATARSLSRGWRRCSPLPTLPRLRGRALRSLLPRLRGRAGWGRASSAFSATCAATTPRRSPPKQRVTHLGAELEDFSDTAAVLALCDLVIAVDTARRASCRRHGPAGLGAGAVRAGLALDARRRNHALVSDGAAVPADFARRLGRRHRARRRGAKALHAVGWAKARSAVPTSASTKSQRQHVGTLRFAHPTARFASRELLLFDA